MNVETYLQRVEQHRGYGRQIVHVEDLPERDARFADTPADLHPGVTAALRAQGIDRLYTHQAEAIALARGGSDVVVVTGTASGKTLCYNVPVCDCIGRDPLATALYLFPTKALTQDQMRGIGRMQRPEDGLDFLAGAYDGDTPGPLRRRLRDGASVLLTNPDMLHQGILPHHSRWNRFFSNLAFVVIDEVHAYRGVFGSNLANVLRRLDRICRHYGAEPRFICSSATIGNPLEHAERITGRRMRLITEDGSPRGPKRFVLWNPPAIQTTAAAGTGADWRVGGDRRSAMGEAVDLMSGLVAEGVQTIAFVRTRLMAEMIFRSCRERLARKSRRLSEAVHAYRGGYLPEERREIEKRLVERSLLGVASTNALELGIDIGSLDACLMVGYPGTIASLWQQAGRAGRGREEALVVLIADNGPIDQYLMQHSEYLFRQNPEQAVIDPDNPHVVIAHLRCAAHELPMSPEGAEAFGPYAGTLLELLEEDGSLRLVSGKWYWCSTDYPAANVSLRNIAGPVYTIQDDTREAQVIGTIDEVSAFAQLHDNAVYLHGAETYLVTRLDIERKVAHVERRDLEYYTQSIQVSQIGLDEPDEEREYRGGVLGFGDVTVTTSIPMFKKVRFHARDSLGFERLDLPAQTLETVAFWYAPPADVVQALRDRGYVPGEALLGIAGVLVDIAPFFVMCDASDIGITVDAACLGRDAIFLHDRYPGGLGFARRCLDRFHDLLETVAEVIRQCPCEDGCPSCVGSAVPAFAQTDLDSAVRGRVAYKAPALALLELLPREPGEPPALADEPDLA